MSAIVIRNIPETVHDALREMARQKGQSVEAVARELLSKAANDARPYGINFERLAQRKKELGIGDWPEWTEEMDDPALSRRVLGLED